MRSSGVKSRNFCGFESSSMFPSRQKNTGESRGNEQRNTSKEEHRRLWKYECEQVCEKHRGGAGGSEELYRQEVQKTSHGLRPNAQIRDGNITYLSLQSDDT
ncbi:unnamed protein product [Arctogadus glacialis]